MGMLSPSAFQDHFATLTDPRCPAAPNSRHLLMDILIIAVCAVISGAEGWEDLEEYGKAHAAWFADCLDLPHGIPGHDTFRRVLSQLDPEELPSARLPGATLCPLMAKHSAIPLIVPPPRRRSIW
jgi:hypothetical protein